jgi:cell volume regulation protein A
MEAALIGIGSIVFAAHLFQAVFERTRVPDVLPFFLIGLLIGPTSGFLTPAAFGELGEVFSTVVLTIILFEGGLNLRIKSLLQSMDVGARLTLYSFAASLVLLPAITIPLLGFSWVEGLMAGAIVGGTSSAVVVPMIAKLPLSDKSRTALFLESSLSDVLCIVVTLALADSIRAPELRPGLMLGRVMSTFLLATVIGAAGGLLWSAILEKVHDLDHSISTTPAFLLVVYGVSESLGFSGAISALAFGVILGNIKDLVSSGPLGRIASFRPVAVSEVERAVFAEIVFLMKAFFFVYIGLHIRLGDPRLLLIAVLVSVAIYIARIPVIRLAFDRTVSRDDAALAAVLAPKGLAAAVLAAVPSRFGFPNGASIESLTYGAVFMTIVITSTLVFLLRGGSALEGYRAAFKDFPDTAA